MLSTVVLTIALNLLQPAGAAPSRMAPVPIDETVPVAVPPATATALRYYASGNLLWVLDQVVSLALLAGILFSGLSARLRSLARRIGRNWFFTIVVYFALFTILTSLITLPLSYYEEFVRQHEYGLSNQTLQKWWTRFADDPHRHLHRRSTVPVGAVSAAAQEPAPMVALYRRCRDSLHHRRQSRRADLDRAAVQQVRADARQGTGGAGS